MMKHKLVLTVLTLCFVFLKGFMCLGAAGVDTIESDTEIVRSFPYTGEHDAEPDGWRGPQAWYEPGPGQGRYYLDSWKITERIPEPYTTYEEQTFIYHDFEWADKVPDTKEFKVVTEDTGQRQTLRFPLLWTEYGDYVWKDGFEFPITVENWDAEYYMLGDTRVPQTEENPFEGYEDELLNQLGLDTSQYEINHTQWISEAYEEQGIWYRKAIATGVKRVTDVMAAYGAAVTWTPEPVQMVEAVYKKETSVALLETILPESEQAAVLETLPGEAGDLEARSPGLMERLYRLMTTSKILRISILFLVFILLAIKILMKYCKKEKKTDCIHK